MANERSELQIWFHFSCGCKANNSLLTEIFLGARVGTVAMSTGNTSLASLS